MQLQNVLASLVIVLTQLSGLIAQIPPETPLDGLLVRTVYIYSENAPERQLGGKNSLSIEEMITEEAEGHGVDPKLAIFLATVESNLNPSAKNPSSTALGIFQFLKSTWEERCEGERTDPRDNTRCAMQLLSKGEINHWTSDPNTRKKLELAGFIK